MTISYFRVNYLGYDQQPTWVGNSNRQNAINHARYLLGIGREKVTVWESEERPHDMTSKNTKEIPYFAAIHPVLKKALENVPGAEQFVVLDPTTAAAYNPISDTLFWYDLEKQKFLSMENGQEWIDANQVSFTMYDDLAFESLF